MAEYGSQKYQWKECDNCNRLVPYPRSLCGYCEVDLDGPIVQEPVLAPHEGRSSVMIPTRKVEEE